MLIAGSTFIVTGGSGGLGESTVRHLIARGANVSIFDIKVTEAVALVAELNHVAATLTQSSTDPLHLTPIKGAHPKKGAAFFPGKTDVTSEAEVRESIRKTIERFGSFVGVVHCSGVGWAQKILDRNGNPAPQDAFDFVVRVNVSGTYNVNRLVAAELAKNKPSAEGERGVIINVSSVSAMGGQAGQTAYAGSKGAVASMTVPMMSDLAPLGIRVLAVAPGLFETPMSSAMGERARANILKSTEYPPRLGVPHEFGHFVISLIENTYLNGAIMKIDGGMRLGKL
ncbi:hypothetical protein BJ742DRAFT_81000 [Cladochytrium replicatum]|nr:hypothetical protein BJ742DRAFT_81000 [Cladochytrium replicatum]